MPDGRHADERADTGDVDRLERAAVEDLGLDVPAQELRLDVVTRHSKRRLSEIVGAEAEEVGVRCDVLREQACARQFDHGADRVLDSVGARFAERSVRLVDHQLT